MSSGLFTTVFVIALLGSMLLRLWLANRQGRHVARHRAQVPAPFADRIPLHAHQRAADYTLARLRLAQVEWWVGAALLLAFTLLGGLQALNLALADWLPASVWWRDLLLIGAVILAGSVVEQPLNLYRQFRLEQRFGFNRMTWRLYLSDGLKGLLLSLVLGTPVLLAALWLMRQGGDQWWFWVWLLWVGFNVVALLIFPTVIAPLFNRFEPLPEGPTRERIEGLLHRAQFATKGLFVMDGSRRSAHGNAYFTGLGRSRRIVFFDTLLARLQPAEVEAVLAHELGHFKHRHVLKRVLGLFALSFLGLALLGWLSRQTWFYQGLGVSVVPGDDPAMALILFALVLPVFTFFVKPVLSRLSRRDEFQADAYAARETDARDLISALVKLYQDNAATLTPDPLHSAFYDSHPPASVRVGRLRELQTPTPGLPADGLPSTLA